MDICSNNHYEVCFEGNRCPCCEIIKDKKVEVEDLLGRIGYLQGEMEDLRAEQEEGDGN